jgi:hypothetical protein
VSAHSAGVYTATLLVMVNVMKGGGRAPPPPSPDGDNFTLMTECTPESSGCYSVYSVVAPKAVSKDKSSYVNPRLTSTYFFEHSTTDQAQVRSLIHLHKTSKEVAASQ